MKWTKTGDQSASELQEQKSELEETGRPEQAQCVQATGREEPQMTAAVSDTGYSKPTVSGASGSAHSPTKTSNQESMNDKDFTLEGKEASNEEKAKAAPFVIEPASGAGTIEVLKVLAPLIQSGTLHRSLTPPESQVTYIVHHDEPSSKETSPVSAYPEGPVLNGNQEEEGDWRGCFGRHSFRKSVKVEEPILKASVKPTLAAPPSVKKSKEDNCILIKSTETDVNDVPRIEYDSKQSAAQHFVVIAIDFGTTFSGYAFRFTGDLGESIHIMKQWDGGDPGAIDYKTLTTLLLTPDGKFHSFGFAARNFYHDLSPDEAKKWMYFEKFKMHLHSNADLNLDTEVCAVNGQKWPAIEIFSLALKFFKDHALQELSDQSSTAIKNDDVKWIITVPAIWKSSAKQFMRQAAYQAGVASPENPAQLIIALEPEAASIAVRREKFQELVPDSPPKLLHPRMRRSVTPGRRSVTPARQVDSRGRSHSPDRSRGQSEPRTVGQPQSPQDLQRIGGISVNFRGELPSQTSSSLIYADTTVGQEVNVAGNRYLVVDCGGGTIDITVHEIQSNDGTLAEIYRASGGPYGSVGVDREFEKLLADIFGSDFMEAFRRKRPAGWVDLMMAFESRKRAADPNRPRPLNVSLPFSFIDYHKKFRGFSVDTALSKYGSKDVSWTVQGMLRLTPLAMADLFQPTLQQIVKTIQHVLQCPTVTDIKFLFLVGGFGESPMVQCAVRKAFGHLLKVLIPYEVSLAILKGAVSFGCDPTMITIRKSRLTYGVATQMKFMKGQHPKSKLVTRDGEDWCRDIFDVLVRTDQPLSVGDTVTRRYTLIDTGSGLHAINIQIYSTESRRVQFTTDSGVKSCGTLCLELDEGDVKCRDIQLRMTFGSTEISVAAIDTVSGKCMRAMIDFLNK